MVSLSTQRRDGLTAAVRDQPFLRLRRRDDVCAVHPIKRVVAPAALELQGEGEGVMIILQLGSVHKVVQYLMYFCTILYIVVILHDV